MADHKKPTQAELDAEIQAALALEDELKKNPKGKEDEEEPPEPSPSPAADEEDEDEEEGQPSPSPSPAADEEDEDEEEEPPASPPKEKKTPTPEERQAESTREAQRLAKQNKDILDAIEKGKAIPEPTEEELRGENPDWDTMSDSEKRTAKRLMIMERKDAALDDVVKESRSMRDWDKTVSDYVKDPQTVKDHPELVGKEEEFKHFCTDIQAASRRNAPFELLIDSFMIKKSKEAPKKKGGMFPTGSGGGVQKKGAEKSDGKISFERAAWLMEHKYDKYRELLMAGKIPTTPTQ